jgi:single-strand DNA-binding protein
MNSTEQLTVVANTDSKDIINQVILTGNLGKAPTLDTVGTNSKVCKFSVATNQDYKNLKGELIKNTLWHNITVWGKLAVDVHEKLQKGSRVTIMGKINYKQYTDKNGVKKTWTDIILDELISFTNKDAA